MRKSLWVLGCAAVLAAGPASAFPDKPVRAVIAYDVGGTVDVITRVLLRAMEQQKLLPQPVIPVNMPGAGGAIGTRHVKDQAADGHTVLITHVGLLSLAAMDLIDFGPEAFVPVAEFTSSCYVYAVRGDSPIKSLPDLIAGSRTKPVRDATNIGSAVHFASLIFAKNTGANLRFVQAGGGPVRFQQVAGDHADASMFTVTEYQSFKAQGLRALVQLGETRDPLIPDVPTSKELGFDIDFCISFWMLAPRGTPPDRVRVLADAVEKAMADPGVQKEMRDRGQKITFRREAALGRKMDADFRLVKEVAASLPKKN